MGSVIVLLQFQKRIRKKKRERKGGAGAEPPIYSAMLPTYSGAVAGHSYLIVNIKTTMGWNTVNYDLLDGDFIQNLSYLYLITLTVTTSGSLHVAVG